ncbi:MAG: hypothetical protein WAK17_14035 [Candidatus Nitrosopolaris sp.]
MISIKDSVIIFVLASTGIGLSIVPLMSYGEISNSTSSMNSTSTSLMPLPMRTHASLMSVLTIAPWPTVKQGNAFVITGKLIDAVTLQPLPGMHVAFKAVFIPSPTLFGAKPMNIPSQITDSAGNFKATVTAPNEEGIISTIASFSGTKSFYPSVSLPSGINVRK